MGVQILPQPRDRKGKLLVVCRPLSKSSNPLNLALTTEKHGMHCKAFGEAGTPEIYM
jgi:hypothetical protein